MDETRLDRLIEATKNHKIVSVLLLVSIAVIAAGSLFDAIDSLRSFFWPNGSAAETTSAMYEFDSSSTTHDESRKRTGNGEVEHEFDTGHSPYFATNREVSFVLDGIEQQNDFSVLIHGTMWNTSGGPLTITGVSLQLLHTHGSSMMSSTFRTCTDAIEIDFEEADGIYRSRFTDDRVVHITSKHSESLSVPVFLPRNFRGTLVWVLSFHGSSSYDKLNAIVNPIYFATVDGIINKETAEIDTRTHEDILDGAIGFLDSRDDEWLASASEEDFRAWYQVAPVDMILAMATADGHPRISHFKAILLLRDQQQALSDEK